MNPLPPNPDPWYAVHTKALKEIPTATVLRAHLGLEVYVPEVRRRTSAGLRQTPLFPGYLFVQVNLNRVKPSSINSCPGVLRLLTVDNQPQAVPPEVIATIRKGTDRLNALGGWPLCDLQPGAPVRIKDGPFAGLEAIFIGPSTPQERVRIFLDFLGGFREVQLDASAIEPHRINHPHAHKRGTRGQGRIIHHPSVPR
jgi:transcriptional antiterminator RfaH